MHGQRSRLVQDHQIVVFIQNRYVARNVRLNRLLLQLIKPLTLPNNPLLRKRQRLFYLSPRSTTATRWLSRNNHAVPNPTTPLFPGNLRMKFRQKVQQGHPRTTPRDVQWPTIQCRFTSRQWSGGRGNLLRSTCQQLLLCFRSTAETRWTRFSRHVLRQLLCFRRHHCLTDVTLSRPGFLQRRVHSHALIKHKTFPIPVVATHLFKILQNASVQLVHIPKARQLHVRSRLLTANPARTEHHNRLVLHRLRQPCYRVRKLTKMINVQSNGVLKGANLNFIVVARVQQVQCPPLVQPALQFFRRQFG